MRSGVAGGRKQANNSFGNGLLQTMARADFRDLLTAVRMMILSESDGPVDLRTEAKRQQNDREDDTDGNAGAAAN